jgi:hypothetical protein
VTQYIVETAIGGYLRQQAENIGLTNDTAEHGAIEPWQTYRDRLHQIRVVDPACGSGAFLIAAFDYLRQEFDRVEAKLADLGIERSQLDIDRHILTQNLFGVDLSPESVEITKLSLWLKTAAPGKRLTDLDSNIKVGNSIVQNRSIDPRAFDWETVFSHIFAAGGFDVVVGNPPYVRQEFLSPIKPYLQQHYESFDGVADLYTYFYEKGIKLLRPTVSCPTLSPTNGCDRAMVNHCAISLLKTASLSRLLISDMRQSFRMSIHFHALS